MPDTFSTIINEIHKQCEKCMIREKCAEDDCVLFRIERTIVESQDSKP